jgi:hypothetical protein
MRLKRMCDKKQQPQMREKKSWHELISIFIFFSYFSFFIFKIFKRTRYLTMTRYTSQCHTKVVWGRCTTKKLDRHRCVWFCSWPGLAFLCQARLPLLVRAGEENLKCAGPEVILPEKQTPTSWPSPCCPARQYSGQQKIQTDPWSCARQTGLTLEKRAI